MPTGDRIAVRAWGTLLIFTNTMAAPQQS